MGNAAHARAAASALLSAAVLACSPAAEAPPKNPPWQLDFYRGTCAAARIGRELSVAVSITPEPNLSGINLAWEREPALGAIEQAKFYPEMILKADGRPIRATALGVRPGEHPALFFRFDPRPLLRDHPDGFLLTLDYNGLEILNTDLADAAPAFRRLQDCAAKLEW